MNNRKKMQKKLFDRTRYSIDQADVKSKSYVDFSISNNQYTNLDRRWFEISSIVSIEKREINRGEQRDNRILTATTSGSTTFHFHKNLGIPFSILDTLSSILDNFTSIIWISLHTRSNRLTRAGVEIKIKIKVETFQYNVSTLAEVRLPRLSRSEASEEEWGGGPGVIPRIISTAWLTRSALRFPVAGRSIGRSWLMMACENGKGADGKGRAASGFRSAKGGGGQKPDGSGKGRGGRGGSSRLLHHRSLDQSRSEVDEWEARTKIRWKWGGWGGKLRDRWRGERGAGEFWQFCETNVTNDELFDFLSN